MFKIATCEKCGTEFKYKVPNPSRPGRTRKYCNMCRGGVMYVYSKKAKPEDFKDEVSDPVQQAKSFKENVVEFAAIRSARHEREVREYVDKLLARHDRKMADERDRQNPGSVTVVIDGNIRREIRGTVVIGAKALDRRVST